MTYHPPCLDDLQRFRLTLFKRYYSSQSDLKKSNPARFSLSALYELMLKRTSTGMSPEKARDLLVAVEVFRITQIKYDEYGGSSPNPNKDIFGRGSDFYVFSKDKLGISKLNKLGYEQRLIYLFKLYDYVEHNFTEHTINLIAGHKNFQKYKVQSTWPNKKKLLDEIYAAMVHVYNKNRHVTNKLIHDVPVLSGLMKDMSDTEDKHAKESKDPTNAVRRKQKNLINFIMHAIEQDTENSQAREICAGAIANVLEEIYDSYAEWLLGIGKYLAYFGYDQTRSSLYRISLDSLNKTQYKDISIEEKLYWFSALEEYLTILLSKANAQKYNEIITRMAENKKNEVTKSALDAQIKQFKKDVQIRLDKFKNEANALGYTGEFVKMGATYATQAGLTAGIYQGTKFAINSAGGIGAVSGAVLSSAMAIFGSGGMLLFSGLSYLLVSRTIGGLEIGAARLFVYVLGKVGSGIANKVGETAANATRSERKYEPTPQGLFELRKDMSPEDDKMFVEWVNTLLQLSLVTSDEKQHMRKALNLGEGEMLKPIHHIVKTQEEQEIDDAVLLHGQNVTWRR